MKKKAARKPHDPAASVLVCILGMLLAVLAAMRAEGPISTFLGGHLQFLGLPSLLVTAFVFLAIYLLIMSRILPLIVSCYTKPETSESIVTPDHTDTHPQT